jgi:RNA polymerase sigma-70 factor (ECF subfamily)
MAGDEEQPITPRGLTPEERAREDGLVERARRGDTAAYDELVRRYSGRLYGLIYRMTGHVQDTEDIVQEVFIKAYRSLARFHGKAAFYTWLYRIAINGAINALKKMRRHKTFSLDDQDQHLERAADYLKLAARESPYRDATLSELQQKMNAALQTLSEKHRTVVILHDIQGIPHEDIAKMWKCSVGTVRSRLFYARKILQAELTEYAP